eukprot:m.128794 g.128794  ORF g.128794 m.128794 type:complete len:93 (+) comp17447_c0_seq1:601-879(+)
MGLSSITIIQDSPPFTIGCIGPSHDAETGSEQLVTVDECRSLYTECGNGDTIQVITANGSKSYDLWCPCYDDLGSNVNAEEESIWEIHKVHP